MKEVGWTRIEYETNWMATHLDEIRVDSMAWRCWTTQWGTLSQRTTSGLCFPPPICWTTHLDEIRVDSMAWRCWMCSITKMSVCMKHPKMRFEFFGTQKNHKNIYTIIFNCGALGQSFKEEARCLIRKS